MNRLVVYNMSYPAHCPYLVASLRTLRTWWFGPVHVHAWPESRPVVDRIAKDLGLCVLSVHRDPAYLGKCDQFLDKIRLVREQEADLVLYLDADTTIHGSLDPLFEAAEEFGFCATQWNDWTSDCGIPRNRVLSLLAFPEIPRAWIEWVTMRRYPSPNGGVFAARPGSPVLETWERWTKPALSTYIADEKVLHLLVAKYGETQDLTVAMGGKWNCSHKYQPEGLEDSSVVIYHYHGDGNVRPSKSPRGHALWWPLWQECLRDNAGGCREWHEVCGNRWLPLLKEKVT